MQIIIPAAGKGSRLGPLTKNQTKCQVEINGESLILRALKNISLTNVKKVVIIIGFEGEKLKKSIGNKFKDIEIKYIWNKEFDNTNNIYSIFLAREEIEKDDSIILESDIIFDENLLKDLLKNRHKNLIVADKFESWMDGSLVSTDKNLKVKDFFSVKDANFEGQDDFYKTVNIYKFSKQFLKEIYFPILSIYISKGEISEYYESPLKIIPYTRFNDLKVFNANKYKWYEIDDEQDLDLASIKFSDSKTAFKKVSERFGGLWRFPELIDFCYLVNPYFPNELLIKELKINFEKFIGSYPSTQKVQTLLASRLFNIDKKFILVGNGGAELINELGKYFDSKFNIFSPTFKEYEQKFKNITINSIKSENFTSEVNKLLKKNFKRSGLILVNPDNPSGSFVEKKELTDFISQNKEKPIIIDESFMDFAEKKLRYTLIDKSFLAKHKNVFVIKSIGKSYGTGGLRLGILASGNFQVLKKINSQLSIWNINSLAENFLQISPKYKSEFDESCEKVVKERVFLFNELKKLKIVNPFPSQANYIFCRVQNIDAKELCEEMFEKHNIFMKHYEHKVFKNHIRISVRSREDNLKLIKALKKVK